MKLDHILSKHVNQNHKPRQIGRYWSSEISSIKKGYLTPKNFFEDTDISMGGVRMILTGMAMENMLTKIFEAQEVDCLPQEKKVLSITKEIDLVVKPDFVFPDFVLETKYPFSVVKPHTIPERYKYQLECEYRAFNKPVYLGLFSAPFSVEFIPYNPSKYTWNSIQKTLINFHNKLKSHQENILS